MAEKTEFLKVLKIVFFIFKEKRRLVAANEFERENFLVKKRQVIRFYRRLDSFTQILSPLLFTVFLMYYIMNVIHGDDNECNTHQFNT